jgi:AcrR family transcriptional regulator
VSGLPDETPGLDSAPPIIRSPAALFIAHPGHELRVHGWLETARPVTFVLTRGDGPDRPSRLASTRKIVAAAGASEGSVFGRFEDREIYAALLRRDEALVVGLLDELVTELIALNVEYVVGDAEEGYNPSHDVCRYLTTAAAVMVSRAAGRTIRDFDVLLMGPPDLCPPAVRHQAISLRLDDAALERKLRSAHTYVEVRDEVERALQRHGVEAFRTEFLRPVVREAAPLAMPPFYEVYGEREVASGRYADVIRYDRHVLPLKQALWRHAHIDL